MVTHRGGIAGACASSDSIWCQVTIPRSHPDGYSVNVRCLDEGTLEDMTIVRKDGKNRERTYAFKQDRFDE